MLVCHFLAPQCCPSLSYESHCQSSSDDAYVQMLEEVAALIIKRVETVSHVSPMMAGYIWPGV